MIALVPEVAMSVRHQRAVAYLEAAERALAAVAAELTAAEPPVATALTLLERLGRLERRVAACTAALAPAVADDAPFADTEHRTGARWLAATMGTSVAEAAGTITAGVALRDLPQARAEVAAGRLSGAQLRAVADAAAADPGAEAELLDAARSQSLFGLRALADRVKAAAGDDEQRDRRARAMRRLRCASGTGGDGAFQLQGHGPADDGEVVLRGLRRCAEEVFRTSAARGERPTFEAMQWDALVAMARVALGERSAPPTGGAATKVIVRVDADALLRGHTEPGETCELAGVGPVPVAAVRRIVERGDAFLAAVLTRAEKVSGVVHFGRRPNALQRTALEWLHPTCAVDGCDQTILQWDHRVDWTASRHTVLEELDGLCGPHHRLKTDRNWRLAPGRGKRPLRPPGHPDHPGDPPARSRSPSRRAHRSHDP